MRRDLRRITSPIGIQIAACASAITTISPTTKRGTFTFKLPERATVCRAAVASDVVAVVADLARVENAVAAARNGAVLPAGGREVERLDGDRLGQHQRYALRVVAHPAPGGDALHEPRGHGDL